MRGLPSILIAALAGGSALFQPVPSGSEAGIAESAGEIAARCPQTGNCASCTRCALIGPCAVLYQLCEISAPCAAIDHCFEGCSDDADCKRECLASELTGALAYRAILSCVDCVQCPEACPGRCIEP